jgi:hypothetical protein
MILQLANQQNMDSPPSQVIINVPENPLSMPLHILVKEVVVC